ncbi:MAG: hypothetical protein ABIZ49_13525, partial [Opitutaceae bacterium]
MQFVSNAFHGGEIRFAPKSRRSAPEGFAGREPISQLAAAFLPAPAGSTYLRPFVSMKFFHPVLLTYAAA